MLVFGTMRTVTAETQHGQVFVPFVYYLWTNRVGRVFRIVVTLLAEIDGRRHREQQHIIRSVGSMADGAHPL